MNIQWFISPRELNAFQASCEATIRNVGVGTKAATEQACKEILEASLMQVPRETEALASTGFYEVERRGDIKGYRYEGTVGYASMFGKGAKHDAINPKSGRAVSTYAVIVHEDLDAWHPVGNAKFLENPAREYANLHFRRVAEMHWAQAINMVR